MPAPGPGAYDHPHFDDADAADAYWERDLRIFEPSEEGQPHADPDAPLFVEDVPTVKVVTPTEDEMADRMAERLERRLGWRRPAGETAPITVPWPGDGR